MNGSLQVKANQNKFNQLAKESLKSKKYPLDHDLLYSLQVAKWALEKGKLEVLNDRILSYLDNLLYDWNQDKAWAYLEPEDHFLLNDLGNDHSPENVALVVLTNLDYRLKETVDGYPRPRDLPANFR
jgi:hypothetical protein